MLIRFRKVHKCHSQLLCFSNYKSELLLTYHASLDSDQDLPDSDDRPKAGELVEITIMVSSDPAELAAMSDLDEAPQRYVGSCTVSRFDEHDRLSLTLYLDYEAENQLSKLNMGEMQITIVPEAFIRTESHDHYYIECFSVETMDPASGSWLERLDFP